MITKKFIIQALGIFSVITFTPIVEPIIYNLQLYSQADPSSDFSYNLTPFLVALFVISVIYFLIAITLIFSPELYLKFLQKKELDGETDPKPSEIDSQAVLLSVAGIYLFASSIYGVLEPLFYIYVFKPDNTELMVYTWASYGPKLAANCVQLLLGLILFFKANKFSNYITTIRNFR